MPDNDERSFAEEEDQAAMIREDQAPCEVHKTSESDPLGPCILCGADPLADFFRRRREGKR